MKQEENTKYCGVEFGGIASDVIHEVLKQRDTWRTVAIVLAVGVVIMAAVLAMVIM